MTGFRSIEKLERELTRIGIPVTEIDYGVIKFPQKLNEDQSLELTVRMPELGFEVLDPVSSNLLDQANELIKELVYNDPQIAISDYPAYLGEKLHCGMFEINSIFCEVHGISVFQSARIQQVERIKEMLVYENLGLSEVAGILHLKDERAVKQVLRDITGLSPSYYQKLRIERQMIQEGKDYFKMIGNGMCVKAINVAN